MTEPTSMLDWRMRKILLKLECLSYGSTQAWNPSGGHSGEPDDRVMLQVLQPTSALHLVYRRRYESQLSDDGRLRVIEEAEKEWDHYRQRQDPPPEQKGSFDDWILEDFVGVPAQEVAIRRLTTASHVRKVRLRAGHDPEVGGAVLPMGQRLARDERQKRVKELRAKGLSQRQIAMHLQCDVATVNRDLAA